MHVWSVNYPSAVVWLLSQQPSSPSLWCTLPPSSCQQCIKFTHSKANVLCYPAEFGCSRSNVTSVIKEICLKIWPLTSCFLRSLKVIKTNTERSATYDFLLTFDRNHEPISFLFPDKWRFHVVESRLNFPNPRVFLAPTEGVPPEMGYRHFASKN